MSILSLLRAPLMAAAIAAAAAVTSFAPTPAFAQASAPAAEAAAPAAAVAPEVKKETIENPYGLDALWSQGDFVARGTLIIMIIMSMGSWYIIFTKLFEQRKLLKAADAAAETFW
ncbi:MotA/TolQ/ExbB proton channel family protein, partial [Ideonella sp. LYT19W]